MRRLMKNDLFKSVGILQYPSRPFSADRNRVLIFYLRINFIRYAESTVPTIRKDCQTKGENNFIARAVFFSLQMTHCPLRRRLS